MKHALLLALCFGSILLAAEAPKVEPKITAEQRAKFWRAQTEAIAAQAQAQNTRAMFDAVRAELSKTCGDLPLVADEAGEPACGEKKAEAKK
jgi:hypothetical protein